jgi:hypothetical protein
MYVVLVTLRSEGALGLAIAPLDIPFAALILAMPYLMFLVFFGPLAAAAGGLLALGLESFRQSGVALWKLRAGAVAGGIVAGALIGSLAGAFSGMERDLTETIWLPSGGSTIRNTCGTTTRAMISAGRNPSARAASCCATGTAAKPPRKISIVNAVL